MLKVSILTIGDEICIGQIVNTNSSWIAAECTKLGCSVNLHSTIPDKKEIMLTEMDRLLARSDVLIITGGLGPTHDDITKPTLLEYFDDELVLHEPTLGFLKEFFNRRGYKLTERNKQQAWLPSKCKPLHNEAGTAPGMKFEKNGKFIFSLPGVPAEMKYTMSNSVLPFLKKIIEENKPDVVLYKILQTSGIPESILADRIGDPEKFLAGGSLAFLPSYRGVRLRIGVDAENIETAREKVSAIENVIRNKAGDYIYGEDDENLSSALGKELKKRKMTLAVAESCTGGMIGAYLTDVPGSSEYFAGGFIVYSNEAKINRLGVRRKTILEHGAVAEKTALEMAMNVRKKFGTDFGISATGIAGPGGGTDEKPVGTVWIGLSGEGRTIAKKYVFGKQREMNRERSVATAFNMLLKELKGVLD